MTAREEIASGGRLAAIFDYMSNLRDPSPAWRLQAAGIGVALVAAIGTAVLFAFLSLSAVFGGGNVAYTGQGSPGPVVFRHYTHMWFENGKYKDCKFCHDRMFASQKYGTFVLRALSDSPPKKIRIGKDTSTLAAFGNMDVAEDLLASYEVPRACATCATGNCHDGKESFSRMDCLKCHNPR